jgi:hypothetical protein
MNGDVLLGCAGAVNVHGASMSLQEATRASCQESQALARADGGVMRIKLAENFRAVFYAPF